MEFLHFIRDHFSHAGPILAVGVLCIVIMIERTFLLYSKYPLRNLDRFFDKIAQLVMSGNVNEAIQLCEKYSGKPTARVVKTALSRIHLPEGVIQDGVLLTIQECTHLVMKRTAYLATGANVATLLGLFGTIAGLIQSFEAVAHADAQQKSALLSAGIATAMNATMLGLGVAIPAMIVFAFLTNKSNTMVGDLEQAGIRITDILKQRFYAPEAATKDSSGTPAGGGEGEEERRAA